MPKAVITGNTRGLGFEFQKYFINKGWEVIGYNRQTGLDQVIRESVGCDVFINNAYADGIQIEFLNQLCDSVKKMIVCGSVAAFYPDPNLPVYSRHKKELADRVKGLARSNILMLHLSAKGYNNPSTILKILEIWLEYPYFTGIMFDPTGNPNG